jgi:hypothetical protein
VAGAAGADAAAAPSSLTLGLNGGGPLVSPIASVSGPWLSRATGEGAQIVRVSLPWSAVAPRVPPPGFRAADPASPGYSWASVDATVRSLTSARLQVLMFVLDAPSWAEGPGRPRGATPGAWRPSARQLGLFTRAAALRYSGRYPDPGAPGAVLPRVRYWEAWNEPNLSIYLSPQWTRRAGGGYAPAGPTLYRRMLNAFYASVKQVAPTDVVIGGATAPFGDRPGGSRMQPVTFWQQLLCLHGAALHGVACDRAHFDVLDHHPYDIAGPLVHALDPGDVSIPDMGKLTRLLRAAVRAHTVLPSGPKAVWTAEIGWTSRPPDPLGTPLVRHARWLEQALYVLWREGVSAVLWLQLSDQTLGITPTALEAGLYFADGRPKPATIAYRFPFLTTRQGAARRILAWGRAPTGGRLLIEARVRRRWTVVRRVNVKRFQVFSASIHLRGPAMLRAQIGALTSLTWNQS